MGGGTIDRPFGLTLELCSNCQKTGAWAVSLGIVFKGPEGLVLAADSRVTLTYQPVLPPQSQVES